MVLLLAVESALGTHCHLARCRDTLTGSIYDVASKLLIRWLSEACGVGECEAKDLGLSEHQLRLEPTSSWAWVPRSASGRSRAHPGNIDSWRKQVTLSLSNRPF